MPHHYDEEATAVYEFLTAFGFSDKVDAERVREALFQNRPLSDINGSREYVEQFVKKCGIRDPTGVKPLKKKVESIMSESGEMVLIMDFLVRCRQSRLFREGVESAASSATPSVQSSPFQRRSASRGRVLSTLTGDHQLHHNPIDGSSRSRANSSFTSYDSRMERSTQQMSNRTKSPFRVSTGTPNGNGIPTTRVTPISASNHLFSPSNGFNTPSRRMTTRDDSPLVAHFRQSSPLTTQNAQPVTQPIRAQIHHNSAVPLHSRVGNAITETESTVCECLLSALVGIETRLFNPIHRKMSIKSTASISTSHLTVCQRVLSIANTYMILSHKEINTDKQGAVTMALLSAIRRILGDYIADIDGFRRKKELRFTDCLPIIEKWNNRLILLEKAHRIRKSDQLELLEALYQLHAAYSFDEDRKQVLDTLLDYTMDVFCAQMMEWMTTGEIPAEKWMIAKDAQNEKLVLRKIPIFITETDAKILLDIGKSLPRVGLASDEDLEAIDKATGAVRSALSPRLIMQNGLTPVLRILGNVVCGIVMKMVLTTGRLKEHVQKATSFYFLSDPRFTDTLYTIIKEASMGLRVGSAALSRQTVSSALAAALESTTCSQNTTEKRKKEKLKFTLDALTSMGSTPNVSSKMQFVQPLRPKYSPSMDLMKPIFSCCDHEYESIFHVIWAIDLARLSTQESAATLPPIMRFLQKNYSFRENAKCLVNTLANVFCSLGATLLRVRSLISVQLGQNLARFTAKIDEKCMDVDDVIREHLEFVRRVSVVVFVTNCEKIEHELSNFLRVTFEAQELTEEFVATWNDVIEETETDENVRKARIAEMCQKRTLDVRILMETVDKSQKKLMDLLDEQIAYGNNALID